MKVVKAIIAVIIALFMVVYMIFGSVLFAVDISFDEKNVQKALGTSDSLAVLLQSAEISLHAVEFEDNPNIDVDLIELYRQPEATALFADIFTGTARFILYGEEYNEVNEELVRDYLCAVANHNEENSLSEEELNDYVSVKLDVCTEQFNSYVSGMQEIIFEDEEPVNTMRFLFNDFKFICIAGAVVHMLILILLIRGKLGYFLNAAVFGFSGISMLLLGGSLNGIVNSMLPSGYSDLVSVIFKDQFALVGAVLFALFSVLMAIALIIYIRRNTQEKDS